MIPAITCPAWEADASFLFDYLFLPRTIGEILDWATERNYRHSLVKNVLAWLSFHGRVCFDDSSSQWRRGFDHKSNSR